jgi:energy-coupling factor transport system ATP-binding protein
MTNAESLVALRGVSFRYPGGAGPALSGVDVEFRAGESVAVVGPTGGGKSTLLKVLAGLLPASGLARLEGERRARLTLRCGVVFQSPDDQLVARRAWDEAAFGPRNLGLPEPEVRRRVESALAAVGLADRAGADPETLSGGQKQRLVIAAALALEPQLLILDEPLAQLDPRGAAEVRAVLARLRAERGVALVVAEHRLGEWLAPHHTAGPGTRATEIMSPPAAERVVAVADGRVRLDAPVSSPETLSLLDELGLRLPVAAEVARRIPAAWVAGVRDEAALCEWLTRNPAPPTAPEESRGQTGRLVCPRISSGTELLAAEHVTFRYSADGFALEDASLSVRRGERIALLGANGSGKSTLLALLAGLHRPHAGAVRGDARRGLTFQNPDAMLIAETALAEAAFGPRHARRLSKREARGRARAALAAVQLEHRANDAPLSLSRGQRLRLAVASVLSMGVDVLLLDEPTTGQDRAQIESLLAALDSQCASVVFSTHDVDLACAWADRAVVLVNGRVAAEGAPHELLADAALVERAGLRRPAILELCARLKVPACRTPEELARRLGGDPSKRSP